VAIGSAPEIGVRFALWGQMDVASQNAWFEMIRTQWGPNLVNGYGTLCQPDKARMARINSEWE